MSNVRQFVPNTQALGNIPHMLRYWADMIERDESNGTKTEFMALVMLQGEGPKPAMFIGGEEPPHPLYAAGIFDWCRAQMSSVVDHE